MAQPSLGTYYSVNTDVTLTFDDYLDLLAFTSGVTLGTRATALNSPNVWSWNGIEWHGEPYLIERGTFSVSATSAQTTIMSATIPAGSLGSSGTLVAAIIGVLTNNTGAGRGLTLGTTFGGGNVWGDASGAAAINNNVNPRPFVWRMILENEGLASQRLAGDVRLGGTTAGSVAGNGAFGTADLFNFTFHGTTAINTAVADRVFTANSTFNFNSASYSLVGGFYVFLIPSK